MVEKDQFAKVLLTGVTRSHLARSIAFVTMLEERFPYEWQRFKFHKDIDELYNSVVEKLGDVKCE